MTEQIIWKDVVGYEGLYEVSNTGFVRTNKDKTTSNAKYKVRKWKQRVLKDKTPNGRDSRVALWKDGNPKDFLVHRLVAEAFIKKVEGKESINHIDGNPKNNHISNLEWCNHKENNNHAFDNGLINTGKKVILLNKLTQEAVYFRSLSKASQYLGHKDSYLSYLLNKGVSEVGDYEVFTKAN